MLRLIQYKKKVWSRSYREWGSQQTFFFFQGESVSVPGTHSLFVGEACDDVVLIHQNCFKLGGIEKVLVIWVLHFF